jgi:hypothetical protein
MIPVFYIEKSNRFRISLRRYSFLASKRECPNRKFCHDSSVFLEEKELEEQPSSGDVHPHDDSRWPKQCDCGYVYQEDDEWQLRYDRLYIRKDTGQTYTLNVDGPPVGAIWNAEWFVGVKGHVHNTEDGRILVCKTPGGEWIIDSYASNCTRPGEEHACWVRHGKPEDGTLHVDKTGDTCQAGAGSIMCGGWHGFLHNGHLVQC